MPNKSNSNSLESETICSFANTAGVPPVSPAPPWKSTAAPVDNTFHTDASGSGNFISLRDQVSVARPRFPLNGVGPKGQAVKPQKQSSTKDRQVLVCRYSSFLAPLRDMSEGALCSHKGSPQATEPPWPPAGTHALAPFALDCLLSLFHSAAFTVLPRMTAHVNILHAASCFNIHFRGHQTK